MLYEIGEMKRLLDMAHKRKIDVVREHAKLLGEVESLRARVEFLRGRREMEVDEHEMRRLDDEIIRASDKLNHRIVALHEKLGELGAIAAEIDRLRDAIDYQ